MPQFNWAVVWPVLLALILGGAGAIFVLSHSSHAGGRTSLPAVVHVADAATAGRAPSPQSGVHLSGRVIGTPHLRAEPGSNAIVLQDLQAGETVDASGCSDSCGWYLVAVPDRPSPGWVPAAFIDLQGDDQRLPVIR